MCGSVLGLLVLGHPNVAGLAQADAMSIIGGAVGGVLAGVILALVVLKAMGASALKRGQAESAEVVKKARDEAAEILRKSQVDAKAEYLKIKELAEKEAEQLRKEMKETEQRLNKREDVLDGKLDTLSMKEKNLESMERSLADRTKNVQAKEAQLDTTISQQKDTLLRITSMSMEDARQLLLSRIENEVRHDAAIMIQRVEEQAKDEAKQSPRTSCCRRCRGMPRRSPAKERRRAWRFRATI